MSPVSPNPLLGVGLHAIGAIFAATCYTPQRKARGWSWQTYWLTQAAFCWLLLPILGAFLTIPDLWAVLQEAPRQAMRNSFLLGIAYGIGGTAFGIAIRYIGFSLTYAIAIGLSAVLGTLIPPLVNGSLAAVLQKTGSGWVLAGISVGTLGIGFTGWAGRLKEKDLAGAGNRGDFSLGKGLLLSLMAGVLSAFYGFALEAGNPIADVASAHGAGVFRGNVTYIFANTGAFLTTAVYCIFLHRKNRTFGEFLKPAGGAGPASLPLNFALAALTGLFWYGQFFFYNLGHVHMGTYSFSSWAVHMIMLVLISNVVGIVLREWRGCLGPTRVVRGLALLVLVAAVLLLTYGNQLGEATAH